MNKRITIFGAVSALAVLLAGCGNLPGTSPVTLKSIEITTQPTTTVYSIGDSLDTTGMVVTATYTDGSTKEVTGYSTSGFDSSAEAASQTVTVSYAEGGITMTASFTISIVPDPVLASIAVTTPPTTTEYTIGDSLDTAGMVVTATYSDGSTEEVTGYAISGFDSSVLAASQAVTVTYEEDGITKTASFSVSIKAVIGQIYYADGSVSTSYDSSKTAAGIVLAVNTDGSVSKIMALEQNTGLKWAEASTTGFETIFNTDMDDGSGNWAVIQDADPTGSADAATNYPAFNYCNTYGADSGLTGFDWYLPARNELSVIYSNVSALNTALWTLEKAGLVVTYIETLPVATTRYWSSSQADTQYEADYIFMATGSITGVQKDSGYTVRPIASVD